MSDRTGALELPDHRPLGDLDLHLIGEGRHHQLWTVLGARPSVLDGRAGASFAVWAPNARSVSVVGDWNHWSVGVDELTGRGRSGVWEGFVAHAHDGHRYRFAVTGVDGVVRLRSDPMARAAEHPPANASVITSSIHRWNDDAWVQARRALAEPGAVAGQGQRTAIYELHAGSWRTVPEDGDRPLTWSELAEPLAEHVLGLGFTHVELMPVAEHPYTPSWGYQVTGYYAPTSRYGTPDDLRAFVDALHRRGVGVILDWVPAHFPRDEWALARFDGTALYEHEDPRQAEHPDWGTLVFNFGRNEVRNFLVANALYWIEEFHVDGLRVDAVASMLYLDYSRAEGEWVPNRHGGREDLDAVDFLREVNGAVRTIHPGVRMIAEESTSWDGVTRPAVDGGLGFSHKWNMGWMHDTLSYFHADPVHRSHQHHQITFGLHYAWSEHFVLPLSHDEVVHGKGSLLHKMPGDPWQRFANLRALYGWMWTHPGQKLLFMGAELAQEREWSEGRSLDWHLREDPSHAGIEALVSELNRLSMHHPALWEADEDPASFEWLDGSDASHSIFAVQRNGRSTTDPVVAVANLTPVPRHGYRVGLPRAGRWSEILNTDDARWGGSGVVNGSLTVEDIAWQGRAASAVIVLPPLGVVWLSPVEGAHGD